VADETDVYWTELGVGIFSTPVDGGEIRELVLDNNGWELVADATHLYWLEQGGGGVMRMAKGGGAVQVLTPLSSNSYFDMVALDETHVYWINGGWPGGEIRRMIKDGTAPVEILSSGSGFFGLAVAGGTVYTMEAETADTIGQLVKIPTTGGSKEIIATGVPGRWGVSIEVDGDQLYWLTGHDTTGTITRIRRSDGAATTVTTTIEGGLAMAIGATAIYWSAISSSQNGTLVKLVK
jgi:hypothetical protein